MALIPPAVPQMRIAPSIIRVALCSGVSGRPVIVS